MSAEIGWFENGKARIRWSAPFSPKVVRSRPGKLILNGWRKAILSRQSR